MYRRHGKLDGVWRDCVIVERLLDLDYAPKLESKSFIHC
jgi:hypothetical protein